MKTINVIENQGQYNNDNEKGHVKYFDRGLKEMETRGSCFPLPLMIMRI